jgi:hypothetical protein
MNASTTLIVWEAMCLALLWSVFCRSVRASHTTKLDVRLALWAVGVAALAGMAAPVYGWAPDWIVLAIVAAVVVMQVVFAQHWRHGVPPQFVKEAHRPRRRAGDAQS